MSLPKTLSLLILLIAATAVTAAGQESEVKVVDEVVAQVNDGVITLSGIKRETRALVDLKVQEGMKREEAQKVVDEKRGEIIANLINEELILQRAKELGIENDVEALVNARFTEIMKQNNLKTLESLYEEMGKQGVDPQEIREMWRKQAMREEVIRRDVQLKLYWEPNGAKLKEYYEKNKARFTKPETVTLSEVFLSFAGRDPEAVRAKAGQMVTQLRAGADFVKMVIDQSEGQDAVATKGSLGTVPVKELEQRYPTYAAAVKDLKAGGISDPVSDDVGVHILRVDARAAASNESQFDENAVRMALMSEGFPAAQKKFFAKLREDAYIKVSETYRPLVSPLLFAEERKAKPTN